MILAPPDWLDAPGRVLWARAAAIVARGAQTVVDPAERAALALDLFAWQRARCPAIERVARAFAGPGSIDSLDALPGVPTDAFKTARIACFAPEHTLRVFKTSGTTREVRGEHPFADTSLYVASALASAERWLLPRERYRFVLLAESERQAPHSSLSFMLARFVERWSVPGAPDPWVVHSGALDVARARDVLADAIRAGEPVALLGATFAFVHLHDALAPGERFALPPGSVAMPTGGYKGRARELLPEDLFALIESRFGLPRASIVQEYGMTELSSQAYEAHAEGAPPGHYVAPPWMLVDAVDPETLAPLPQGRRGILRVIDLANVGSCVAIQTADEGTVSPWGFEVHGRAPGATPRGCARALDALLARDRKHQGSRER